MSLFINIWISIYIQHSKVRTYCYDIEFCVEGAVLYLCCWCCHKLIESIRVCTQCAYYNKNTRSYHRDTVPGGWTNQQLYVTQKSVPGSLRGNNDIFFNNKQFLDCQIHKQFFLLSDIRDLSYINFIFGYDLQRFCYLYMKFIYQTDSNKISAGFWWRVKFSVSPWCLNWSD